MSKTNTSNYDAVCPDTQCRYTIKSTTNNQTSSFHGVEDKNQDPVFDYLVILKLDKDFKPDILLEISWAVFIEYARMHSNKKAYDIHITKALLRDNRIKLIDLKK